MYIFFINRHSIYIHTHILQYVPPLPRMFVSSWHPIFLSNKRFELAQPKAMAEEEITGWDFFSLTGPGLVILLMVQKSG